MGPYRRSRDGPEHGPRAPMRSCKTGLREHLARRNCAICPKPRHRRQRRRAAAVLCRARAAGRPAAAARGAMGRRLREPGASPTGRVARRDRHLARRGRPAPGGDVRPPAPGGRYRDRIAGRRRRSPAAGGAATAGAKHPGLASLPSHSDPRPGRFLLQLRGPAPTPPLGPRRPVAGADGAAGVMAPGSAGHRARLPRRRQRSGADARQSAADRSPPHPAGGGGLPRLGTTRRGVLHPRHQPRRGRGDLGGILPVLGARYRASLASLRSGGPAGPAGAGAGPARVSSGQPARERRGWGEHRAGEHARHRDPDRRRPPLPALGGLQPGLSAPGPARLDRGRGRARGDRGGPLASGAAQRLRDPPARASAAGGGGPPALPGGAWTPWAQCTRGSPEARCCSTRVSPACACGRKTSGAPPRR